MISAVVYGSGAPGFSGTRIREALALAGVALDERVRIPVYFMECRADTCLTTVVIYVGGGWARDEKTRRRFGDAVQLPFEKFSGAAVYVHVVWTM